MIKTIFKLMTITLFIFSLGCSSSDNEELNTFTGDITLSSQLQVDNFGANNYKVVNGTLYITKAFTNNNIDISNLSTLSSIKEITGDLTIRFLNIDNLEGLHNIQKVGNTLAISDNYIEDYCALQGLINSSGVVGEIYLDNNEPFEIAVPDFENNLCNIENRPLIPDINVSNTVAYVGDYLVFENITMGDYTEDNWSFEGLNYIYDTNKVMYLEAGVFDVGLTVSNPTNSESVLFGDYMNITHDPDLVAFYQFIIDAQDYSQFNNDGINNGATLTNSDTDFDKAYLFGQGSSSYISVANDYSLNFTNSMSIVAFFDVEVGNINRNMIVKNPDFGSNKVPYGIYYEHPNKIALKVSFENLAEPVELVASFNDSLTTLNNSVVGTWDGDTLKLYIDGQLQNEITLTGTGQIVNSNQPLTIGNDLNGGNNYYIGRLDDIRIYKKALDETEINKLILKWWQ